MLISYLSKQSQYSFCGIINVITKNGSHIGKIIFKNGNIVNAKTNHYSNEKAMIHLLHLTHQEPDDFIYLSEPGDCNIDNTLYPIDMRTVLTKYKAICEDILQLKKLNSFFESSYIATSKIDSKKRASLSTIDFQVLSEIIERKNILKLLSEKQLLETDLFISINHLLGQNLIKKELTSL